MKKKREAKLKIKEKSKKNCLQEQMAKNAEDFKIVDNILKISPINYNEKPNNENRIEIYNNKFDLFNLNENDIFFNKELDEDIKDISNKSGKYIPNKEKEYRENNEIINKFNKENSHKKRSEPFKSTATDFKIKYKTELCKYYEINGYCKYGDSCAYAHGKENLRVKITNTTFYRTKKCVQFFQQGYCPYGNRCQFAHQLSSNIINNPYDRKMTYQKTLETISKQENIENIKSLIEKPRLSVFKEIVDNNTQLESSLLEDIKRIYKEGIIERIDE